MKTGWLIAETVFVAAGVCLIYFVFRWSMQPDLPTSVCLLLGLISLATTLELWRWERHTREMTVRKEKKREFDARVKCVIDDFLEAIELGQEVETALLMGNIRELVRMPLLDEFPPHCRKLLVIVHRVMLESLSGSWKHVNGLLIEETELFFAVLAKSLFALARRLGAQYEADRPKFVSEDVWALRPSTLMDKALQLGLAKALTEEDLAEFKDLFGRDW